MTRNIEDIQYRIDELSVIIADRKGYIHFIFTHLLMQLCIIMILPVYVLSDPEEWIIRVISIFGMCTLTTMTISISYIFYVRKTNMIRLALTALEEAIRILRKPNGLPLLLNELDDIIKINAQLPFYSKNKVKQKAYEWVASPSTNQYARITIKNKRSLGLNAFLLISLIAMVAGYLAFNDNKCNSDNYEMRRYNYVLVMIYISIIIVFYNAIRLLFRSLKRPPNSKDK